MYHIDILDAALQRSPIEKLFQNILQKSQEST